MISLSSYFRPDICLGVHVGNTSIRATALDQTNNSYRVLWSNTVISGAALLTNQDNYAELRKHLSESLSSIAAYTQGRIPIQLALADPVLSSYFLEFDSLPSNQEERRNLITWQLGKQYHIDCHKQALTHQYLGEGHGKHLLIALAVDKTLIDTIMELFQKTGLAPTVLDAGASYLHNLFLHKIHPQSAMAINMEDTYWTMMIWDEHAGLQYLRSKWHDCMDRSSSCYRQISMEAERTVRAFVSQKEKRSVDVIHLYGGDLHTSSLHSQFHSHVQKHCIIHDGKEELAQRIVTDEYPGWTLLAASLCRNS